MTFTPPVLSKLIENTNKLSEQFSIKLGRYNLNEPLVAVTDSSAPQKQNSLELLIARTQQVTKCESRRDTAREVFNQLVNELRGVLKTENDSQTNRATKFLLGALLHRYFRLMQEYDDYNNALYFISPWNIKNCKLFIAIRKALKLPDSLNGDYRKRDLTILDNTTIVTALEVFRDNMLLEDEKKIPRYKKYPHFEQDVNFVVHLQKIIDKHKDLGAPILNQFKAVNFIQALSAEVVGSESEYHKIKMELEQWHKRLVLEHGSFESLSLEKIEEHINNNINPGAVREEILDILYMPHVKDNLKTFNHDGFLAAMKTCNANTAIYTIVGGYALLLQSSNIKELKFCIYEALGIQEMPDLFDEKEMIFGINFLKKFIASNPQAKLDYEFFGDRSQMNTLIAQKSEELLNIIKEKEKSVEIEKEKVDGIVLV